MKTEIEAKFLNCNHEDLRKKLRTRGAVCEKPMVLMRRAILDYPDHRLEAGEANAYVRVRDEGDKVTLTFKQFDSLSIDGAKEIDTTVGSFSDTIQIFEAIGLEVGSLQESKRETWRLDECEVVLDEWPWLLPYVEIEATSEDEVRRVAKQLGFDWSKAVFGDVMVAYRAQYPFLTEDQTVGRLAHVRFADPLPDILLPQ